MSYAWNGVRARAARWIGVARWSSGTLLFAALPAAAVQAVTVVEFYNATLGHYFMTPLAGEIQALDSHQFVGWARTGLSFDAYAKDSHPASAVAICRMYNDHFNGTSTHFYGPRDTDCAATQQHFPDWTFEDPELFDAQPANAQEICPAGQYPIYRVYNNGKGGAPNHRFTNSPELVQQMVAQGYAAETGVRWCTPTPPPVMLPPPPIASATGIWMGTTTQNEPVTVIVASDGTFYAEYFKAGTTTEAGVVYGTATIDDGVFTAGATDSPVAAQGETNGLARAAAVNGTYTSGDRIHLAISGANGAHTLDAMYVAGSEVAPDLASLAGGYAGYTGHAGGRQEAGTSMKSDGTFTGGNPACSYAGTFTSRADIDAFNWTVHSTNGTTCIFGAGPISGIAYQAPGSKKLSAFAPFPLGEIDLYFLIGTRP